MLWFTAPAAVASGGFRQAVDELCKKQPRTAIVVRTHLVSLFIFSPAVLEAGSSSDPVISGLVRFASSKFAFEDGIRSHAPVGECRLS